MRAGGDHLDRDRPPQALVGRRVDRAEAARAEPVTEPVAAEDELRADPRGQLVGGLHRKAGSGSATIPSEPPVILKPLQGPVPAPGPRRGEPDLSFFDEDDEPPRTTLSHAVRPARVHAAASRPAAASATADAARAADGRLHHRRASSCCSSSSCVKACRGTRADNALRDYNRQVSEIAIQSRQTGDEFFKAMNPGASAVGAGARSQIVGWKGQADTALKQAQDLSVPGRCRTPSSRC